MKDQKTKQVESAGKFKKLGGFFQKPLTKKILSEVLIGFYSYLIVFILGQILISGGMSEKNPYFLITIVIALIASQIAIARSSRYDKLKSAIISSVAYLLVFAILDYLLVNLLFEKNNYEFYKFWPNYFAYLTLIALPLIRRKWHLLTSFNPKSLLTKKG